MTMDSINPLVTETVAASSAKPPPKQHSRFSRSLWWLLAVVVTYFIAAFLYAVGVGVYMAATQPDLPQAEGAALLSDHLLSPNGITSMYLATAIPVLLVLLKAASFPRQHWSQTLAFTSVAARCYLPWLAAFAGYYLCAWLVNWLWPVEPGAFIESIAGVRHLGLFVTMVLVAPVVEELVFRGYFFQAWRHSFLGLWGTLLATSMLFTLIHAGQYPLLMMAMLFSFSLILGLAREKTGSLYVPIALHALNNLLAFIVINWLGYI
ncbi:CPBP family intramembrane metalloprotease [Alkalimonas sp. MEB108]|uniref:CPBP family intramembrane metalloprotease n=1 Tax=Alkalimonas cellulosilytica TaxID=3058395 RepID=A0ABU7J8W2_9GAMM|nr:CPBP family intramembrane glutamic endopeptidase [Alkalimonas sp. MEB108]MEE2002670.1 CPBP family intramembrane metalloprotease [Alkalimonas sp. MEB108]